MITLNHVSRVDDLSNFRRILKERRYLRPVIGQDFTISGYLWLQIGLDLRKQQVQKMPYKWSLMRRLSARETSFFFSICIPARRSTIYFTHLLPILSYLSAL